MNSKQNYIYKRYFLKPSLMPVNTENIHEYNEYLFTENSKPYCIFRY